MGDAIVRPQTPHEVLCQLNCRFAPGAALIEMVANHQQFKIFAAGNTLAQIYQLLNIGPANQSDRAQYYKFLDDLKNVPSDIANVNGHDRIIQARRENLESTSPLPMYTMVHSEAADARVTVTRGQPLPFDASTYIIISTPTKPPSAAQSAQTAAMTRPRLRRARTSGRARLK
jgi:hypothetical protein